MEPQPPKKPAPAKMRFVPKATKIKAPKPVPKKEEVEDADDQQAKELLQRFAESTAARKQKSERKVAPSMIAFGVGGDSKSYNRTKGSSTTNRCQGPGYGSLSGVKEYKDPWDYYSYYPVTLPMRRPYSGNPELLDEEEFKEASENIAYDKDLTEPATDLGLMGENLGEQLLFFQFPATLPMIKKSSTEEGHVIPGSSKQSNTSGRLEKTCSLNDLPEGFMGKMLVYKSGAVKLKLGDTLYDVSPGSDCVFAQEVAAINTEEKHCCVVGELTKHVIVTPDIDSIVDSMVDLE